ncbi:uncharacterized protein [Miscanthus floridulus]|uniref:uncharacterized protein n=1 Tax=Miscanthus floridulus TaxID=154761 RepID=UPI0034583D85
MGKEVWDSLKARFVGAKCVKDARLQTLKAEFDALKMKEEETIDEFTGKLTVMSVKYGNLGGTLEDLAMVKKLFDTVPDRFIHVIAGIEQFYDLKTLAHYSLKLSGSHARRSRVEKVLEAGGLRAMAAEVVDVVVVAAGEVSGGRGDAGKESTEKRDKSHIKCFKCHCYGHYANRCPGEKKKDEEAHHARTVVMEPAVLLAETEEQGPLEPALCTNLHTEVMLEEKKVLPELYFVGEGEVMNDVWYLDNGASNHMTGDHHKFRDMDQTATGKPNKPGSLFQGQCLWKADEPLQLVHVDLCGPITPSTLAGNKYFMLLVDDCTRWTTVYMLKSKDQAVDAFIKFRAEARIKHQFTAPYTPQQNGVVERKNRSVMEMARSLLKSMEIPGIFWAEAVRHSVYLLNRLPTKSMGYRTPYEGWNGRKPHLGHVRIFCCKGHVKVVGTHLKKLDDRSIPMVYFGIEEGSKAHRMFNPKTNKIVVSRDVVFEETVKWSWEAVNDENFSENRDEKDGQFFSGDYNYLDGGVGDGHDAQDVSETGGASSGGEESAVGGNGNDDDIDSQSASEENPTTEQEPVTP